ncbi:MAG: transposase [Terracidiphilus sp.]|jgi:transposase
MEDQASVPGDEVRKENSNGYLVDFLDLPHCTTLQVDQVEHVQLVHALYRPGERCVKCKGVLKEILKKNPEEPFGDIPRGNNPVVVVLTRARQFCIRCRKFQGYVIPWYHKTRRMTDRLIRYIWARAATLATFEEIAFDTCLDANTVESVFMDHFRGIDEKRTKNLPRVLGIDEVHFSHRYHTILVDGDTGKTVDLLDGLTDDLIKDRLNEASNRETVEYLVQNFSLQFRRAATKPPSRGREKNGKESSPSPDAKQTERGPLISLLFPDPAESDTQDSAEKKMSIQRSREVLKALLPNAKVVGDHYHFKKAIEDGFNNMRVHVRNTLFDLYYDKIKEEYTEFRKTLQGAENVEAEVKAAATKLVKIRRNELNRKKHILFKHLKDPIVVESEWLKKIFADHPILKRGWEAKNQGLNIFPVKPPLGKTKKAREAARIERAALLMTEQEASKKLDEWVASVVKDEELKEYFKTPLNMIANWREEIIRIGTTGYSNARAESKNRYLRRLMAISRGLGFEKLRARLLWADERHRANRWPSFCYDQEEDKMDMKRFVELARAHIAKTRASERP